MKKAMILGFISSVVSVASVVLTFWAGAEEAKVQDQLIDEAVDRKITALLAVAENDDTDDEGS